MADKAWKAMERRIAKWLGGKRVPLSGENNGFASGDVDHKRLFIECKQRKSIAIARWWDKANKDKAKALGEHKDRKETVLIIQEKHSPRYLALVDLDMIIETDAMVEVLDREPEDVKKRIRAKFKEIMKQRGKEV